MKALSGIFRCGYRGMYDCSWISDGQNKVTKNRNLCELGFVFPRAKALKDLVCAISDFVNLVDNWTTV